MRNAIASAVLLPLTVGLLLPPAAAAQRGQQRAQAGAPGRGQCAPSDSARAFRRGIGGAGADTARMNRAGRRMAGDTTGGGGGGGITGGTQRSHEFPEYDVVLDVPNVCVGRIYLKVDSVTARLALNAQVANLLRVNAGADVLIGTVDLTIQGVRAQALLLVDLDDVVHVVDNTLTFIDNNPQVVRQLTGTLQNVVGTVGGLVGGAMRGLVLSEARNQLGQTVQRYINQATGAIVERTLSEAGQSLAERTVGSLLTMPVVRETTTAANQVVRQVRDQTGAVIEYTLNRATNQLSNIRVLQQAPR
jgi:hypothetical protein